MSDMSDLIHVGYTNEYQIDYAKDDEGSFYCDSDDGCNIPIYMLSAHSMRANNSAAIGSHEESALKIAELQAEVERLKTCNKVYVLIGEVDYEGSDNLGVFDSHDLAIVARDNFINERKQNYYDEYVINEYVVQRQEVATNG